MLAGIKLYYIKNTVCLLHVSATLVAILREKKHYTGCICRDIATGCEPKHRYKILILKRRGLKYVLEYETLIIFL